jgi:hypothetical protein
VEQHRLLGAERDGDKLSTKITWDKILVAPHIDGDDVAISNEDVISAALLDTG